MVGSKLFHRKKIRAGFLTRGIQPFLFGNRLDKEEKALSLFP